MKIMGISSEVRAHLRSQILVKQLRSLVRVQYSHPNQALEVKGD